jgi:gas vesicle protein
MGESGNGGGSGLGYFLAGLGVGAIAALLFAPKSGEETRGLIAQKANEGRDYMSQRGQDLRRQAEGLVSKGKEAVNQQRGHLQAALEAGKQAYQQEKSKSEVPYTTTPQTEF